MDPAGPGRVDGTRYKEGEGVALDEVRGEDGTEANRGKGSDPDSTSTPTTPRGLNQRTRRTG